MAILAMTSAAPVPTILAGLDPRRQKPVQIHALLGMETREEEPGTGNLAALVFADRLLNGIHGLGKAPLVAIAANLLEAPADLAPHSAQVHCSPFSG
ncbi:MAG: hypothetical protein ACREMD_04395 [Gemmatimonadota bacterium]